MVEVTILLPGGARKTGRLDPEASFDYMKEAIIEAHLSGEDPDDYEIAIIPKGRNTAAGYKIGSGDVIHILRARSVKPPAYIPDSEP